MNIQKIQASTQNVKGFTLVELIVVITILVILGTIAFLNLGSFSAGARDSQRTSDLNQINTQIAVTQAKQGLTFSTLVVAGSTTNLLSTTGAKISGSGATTTSEYSAWDLNYAAIGVDSSKMKDPITKSLYKIGQTSLGGGAYELAATLEDNGKSALVMGTYRARTGTGTASVNNAVAVASGSGSIVLATTSANFKIGDWVTGTSGVALISAISSDQKTITFATSPAPTVVSAGGATFKIINDEVAGLVGSGTINPVINGGTTYLPY